jgi:hypothetical protein
VSGAALFDIFSDKKEQPQENAHNYSILTGIVFFFARLFLGTIWAI